MSLSDFGSYASIFSFAISLFTLYLLNNIRNKFLFKVTIDKNTSDLKKLSSKISSLLESFHNNINDLDEIFKIIDIKFRFLQKAASGNLLKDIKEARNKIKTYYKKIYFSDKTNKNSGVRVKC